MNVFDVVSKLNLRSSDYVANVVVNQELLAALSKSAKGAVGVDSDKELSRVRKNPDLRDLKLIDIYRSQLDENAFDKIVCIYDETFFGPNGTKILQMLCRATDRNGYFLIVGVPHFNKDRTVSIVARFVDWVCKYNLSDKDYWIFNSEEQNSYDLLFRVRKDADV